MKTVYILRSIPGAGKSTVAENIHNAVQNSGKESVICCADDFLIDENGEYKWTAETIGIAHLKCLQKFTVALNSATNIIVSNTNIKTADVRTYKELAEAHGYTVFVLIVENWHNGTDVHNVSIPIKLKMVDDLKNNMKLFNKPEVMVSKCCHVLTEIIESEITCPKCDKVCKEISKPLYVIDKHTGKYVIKNYDYSQM